jgi:hypothetical protein
MAAAKPTLVATHEIKTYSGITYQNIRVEVAYPDQRVWDDPLRGLYITAQQGCDATGMQEMRQHLYAWHVEFRYGWGGTLDLKAAERMYKILKAVDASLTRQSDRLGIPADFGQYVLRVAAALKIDTLEIVGGYSSTLAGAADQIRGWEREFAAQYATTD